MQKQIKIINPYKLTEADAPLWVFSSDNTSPIGNSIDTATSKYYEHIMLFVKPGFYASQTFLGFKSIPMQAYDKSSIELKFWKCNDITEHERQKFIELVNIDLDAPWWKRLYDPLSFVGHLTGFRFIQFPFANNCAERTRKYSQCLPALRNKIGKYPNPGEMNHKFIALPCMEVAGYVNAIH